MLRHHAAINPSPKNLSPENPTTGCESHVDLLPCAARLVGNIRRRVRDCNLKARVKGEQQIPRPSHPSTRDFS